MITLEKKLIKKTNMKRRGPLFRLLKFSHSFFLKFIPESSPVYKHLYYLGLKLTKKERMKPMDSLYLYMALALHCNLNCKSCFTFSPLAHEKFYDVESFEHDIRQIAKLTNGKMDALHLIGGEPLLHPKLNDCIRIARQHIKIGNIFLSTNGILLKSQSNDFWKTCADNNIVIEITRYPINIDIGGINEKANDYSVTVKWADFHGENEKNFRKMPIDCEGKQNPKEAFSMCMVANKCAYLMDGKLYNCFVPLCIASFNDAFNENLNVCEDDYLDIHKVESIEEIFHKLCRPIPFCRYCATTKMQFNLKWSVSGKKRSEWEL